MKPFAKNLRLLLFTFLFGLLLLPAVHSLAQQPDAFERGMAERLAEDAAEQLRQHERYREALDGLYRAAITRGDLDGVLAVRDEQRRLSVQKRLTARDIVKEPADLARTMTEHLAALGGVIDTRKRASLDLMDAEVQRRTAELAPLTRAGDMERAKAAYRELKALQTRVERFRVDGSWLTKERANSAAPAQRLASGEFTTLPQAFRVRDGDNRPRDITRLKLSADQSTLLVGGNRTQTSVWDFQSRKHRDLPSIDDTFWSMDLSPDGRIAVACGDGQTVYVWDTKTATLRHRMKGHAHKIWGACLIKDGTFLVTSAWDRTLRVWDLNTGRETTVIHKRFGSSRALTALDDDHVLGGFTGHADRPSDICVINLTTGHTRQRMKGHHSMVTDVALNRDKTRVLSCSTDRTLRLWDLERGEELWQIFLEGGWLEATCFSADEQIAFVVSDLPNARAYAIDIATGKEVWKSESQEVGLIDVQPIRVKGVQAAMTAAYDGWVRFHEVPK